jgi:solute carrier family 9 (sodium/hydrogen exchanger), member 8
MTELFLRHITPICLFACLGTAISAITIGFTLKWIVDLGLCGSFYPTLTELLTFGALISATDPVSTLAVFQSKRVDPHLFYLVFGESVLNDAVGLVMFNAMAKFVQRDNDPGKVLLAFFTFLLDFSVDFFGSLVLGLVFGIVSALVLKQVDMRTTTLLELSLYILIMYFPFLLAEIMELSGIVTILFTGIAARRYMVPNLSLATKSNADVFFRLSAHLAETSIFLELGLSVFGLTGGTEWRFVFWAILACLLGRAMNISPITYFFNRSLRRDEAPLPDLQPGGDDDISTSYSVTPLERKDMKIPMNTAHMMWYSGLRGAVAYACCRTFPNTFEHQNQFIVATMMIVLTTVFVLGGTTELALNFLSIDMNIDENNYVVGSSRVPPMVAFMIDFENRYIMGCVVRKPAQTNGGDSEMMASSPSTSIPDDYNPYVEMTVTDHARKLKMMAYQDQQAESVYDFGK